MIVAPLARLQPSGERPPPLGNGEGKFGFSGKPHGKRGGGHIAVPTAGVR